MAVNTSTIPATTSPFTYNGNITLGTPIILPPVSQLQKLPDGQGYGCFEAPFIPVGFPLFNWSVANSSSIKATDLCYPGFLCPYLNLSDPNTVPVACPASVHCEFDRLSFQLCPPQGRYEPVPCPAGFYCPDYKTVLVCPKGSFCLTGSSTPRPCQFLSSCPEGSVTETHFGTLVIVLVLDIILLIFLAHHRLQELKRAKEPAIQILHPFLRRLFTRKQTPRTNDNDPALSELGSKKTSSATLSDLEDQTSVLVNAFKRGFEGIENPQMNFEFSGLSLTLPSDKTILQGVTGEIKAGRMTAIMGPSGAGKTTFMNVLMGKASRTGGELKINGAVAEMETFRKIIGYVPQEDIMHRELTVKEIITYAARIRLPASWSNGDVDLHTDNVIQALNLTNVAHSQIGDVLTRGISGGQRKRVNIGMELAAAPLAIFLDEPTSGLDATSALDVSNILRAISRLGLTIVSVIHQPRIEIFNAFDDVLMIAPGGKTAYLGPVTLAQSYFESLGFWFDPDSNKADVLMDILAGRGVPPPQKSLSGSSAVVMSPEQVLEAWLTRGVAFVESHKSAVDDSAGTPEEAPPTIEQLEPMLKNRGAGFWTQFLAAHSRSLTQQARSIGAFWMEVFVGAFAGFIMGIASGGGESYVGVLVAPYTILSAAPKFWFLGMYGMLIGIAVALASAPSGVKVFGEEKPVYFREAASGHNKAAYYLGKTVSVLYRIALTSLHFTAIYYLLATPNIPVGLQFLLFLLNFFGIYGVSVIISMLVKRENAPLISVIIGLFIGVFCGFGPVLTPINSIVFDLSPNRWAADTQYGLWIQDYEGIYDVDQAVKYYGYRTGYTTRNLFVMLVLGTGYRFIGYFLMVLLNRDKQK